MGKDAIVSAAEVVRDSRRQTRRKYGAREKIRIVLEDLRGEAAVAELCRRESITRTTLQVEQRVPRGNQHRAEVQLGDDDDRVCWLSQREVSATRF